ncbi:CPBP family intramembrane metalloprotease [Caldithrix abyssi]|nr:CPBP family intramembrane metalloprotease [Caldithrix abyssi]
MRTTDGSDSGDFALLLKQHQLTIFFVLTLLISAALAAIAVTIGDENITILTVLGPSVTAIVLTSIISGKAGLRELLVEQTTRRVSFQWVAVALLGIPIVAAVAIGLHSLLGGPELRLRTTTLLPQIIIILIISLGEEYGWRGYALPKLQKKYSALVASVILGLIWGFWHYPGYLIGTGVPLEMPFFVFMLWVIPATVLITWVYNNAKSVLMAVLMHLAANATFNYLPLLPEFIGQITTFWLFIGLLWLVTIIVVAVYGPAHLVRRRVS